MKTPPELNLTYIKARMLASQLISFGIFETMQLEIKKFINLSLPDILQITVAKYNDMEDILKKKDKLQAFETEIGMKIKVDVK